MNKWIGIGRATKDAVITMLPNSNHKIARVTIAIDRRTSKEENAADFIPLVAWDKKADFFEKYVKKGTKLAIAGRIQTGSYDDKDGKKIYTSDVVVEDVEFCESKRAQESSQQSADGFINVPDGLDDEGLPF